ncbi:MAG: hypothetical protein NTU98_12495 [Bacteroidetes bacterium]|nr:hypothetical protein [Bacteroidota bacterium]
MKRIFILAFLAASLAGYAQQKTLVVEKIGTSRRYAYRSGDDIKIQTRKDHRILKNYLWISSDTAIIVGVRTMVPLSDIGAVYHPTYLPKLMTNLLLIAGAGYIILDSFNNLINHELVIEQNTLIIGGSLIAAGVLLIPFHQKKCRIGVHWKVKVLDINIPVYF